MAVTVEDNPVMRATLYPAQVTLPDGTVVRRAKFVVTVARVYVFTAPDVAVFVAAYDTADLPSNLAPRSARWTIRTAVGDVVAQRMAGCGCGVALKTWQPFVPERWATV